MVFKFIKLEIADDIALLTLNQPGTRNGLTATMQEEMLTALAHLREGDDARALILTGAGKSFCAGADLDQLEAGGSGLSVGQSTAKIMKEVSNPLILALQNLAIPMVSAVNGAAAGAGVSLALAADIVVASRSAFFLTPFLPRLGIVPDMGDLALAAPSRSCTYARPDVAGRSFVCGAGAGMGLDLVLRRRRGADG